MNIELRSQVLEKALVLENSINQLVLIYLGIKKEDKRAIGHKSGTLTYKNILDLLYDIDVLDSQEYNTLLLLMQFRNQFMHNIECDSFQKAVALLGSDRGRTLRKFNDTEGGTEEEEYKNSFFGLAQACLGIILKKMELKRKDIKEKSAYVRRLLDFIVEYDEMIHQKLDHILDQVTIPDMDLEKEMQNENGKFKFLLEIDITGLKQEFVSKFGEFTNVLQTDSDDMAGRILK